MKTYRMVWTISILIIAVITIVSVLCSFAGVALPDALVRVFGLLDLISVAALVFSSVKLKIWKKDKR